MISEAFSSVTRSGGVSLHEADVIDDYGSDEDRTEARKLDRDRTWQDVPSADIERFSWVLSFMDPIGFRYYLPAYMTWALKNYRNSNSASIDHAIYSLTPSDKVDIAEWQEERFNAFSASQAQAIKSFLHYMAKNSDGMADGDAASEALSNYWAYRK